APWTRVTIGTSTEKPARAAPGRSRSTGRARSRVRFMLTSVCLVSKRLASRSPDPRGHREGLRGGAPHWKRRGKGGKGGRARGAGAGVEETRRHKVEGCHAPGNWSDRGSPAR